MSGQQTLSQFFTRKVLQVPKYQRSYAWRRDNLRELFEDIQEAIRTNSKHYIGTVVLAKTKDTDVYSIVDGQQRITTILMFINSLVENLNEQDKNYYRRLYIKAEKRLKLSPLGRDRDFFENLLEHGPEQDPESKSQRYMLEVYDEIQILNKNVITDHLSFLKAIEDLSILEFIEEDEGSAIRIFQTVNDRGRELSRMDKMKSLLFYFSNKYLKKRLDDKINETFGEIFELYDDIKLMGESRKINVISSKQFTEDDLMRHHYICFSNESYDPTAQQVMETVKAKLFEFRNSKNEVELDKFISNYITSLHSYIKSFKSIINKTSTDEKYYKIFSILGLNVALYPVLTQLEKLDLLDKTMSTKKINFIDMVEIIDVRVMKVREYAGRKNTAEFSYSLENENLSIDKIEKWMLWFNNFEISDDKFRDYIANDNYYKSTGLLRLIFIDHCEKLNFKLYSLNELENIMDSEPTIEHILSQAPKFKPRSYDFKHDDDFEEHNNRIGNLTILEKKINSSINNNDLVNKIPEYSKSQFNMTRIFATTFLQTKKFKKDDLISRGDDLALTLSKRWWA